MAQDLNTKEKFIELRSAGESYDKIAKKLGISKPTAIKWGKEFSKEISNLKADRLDALKEQYTLAVEAKIQMWGNLVKNINNTLNKKDLSYLDSARLLSMLIKAQSKLESSYVEPVFESVDEK